MFVDRRVSESKLQFGLVDEAIDYAGQSLVLCIKSLGLIHEKTAESHFYLAFLYEKCGDTERARKEYRICTLLFLSLSLLSLLSLLSC